MRALPATPPLARLALARLALASALPWIAGCGGLDLGGGTSVRVDPAALRFQARAGGGDAAEPRQVIVTFDGDGIVWGTVTQEASGLPAWLSFTPGRTFETEEGAHAMTFTVGVTAATLAPGEHPFVLRFLTGRGDLEAPRDVSHADLTITYEVLAPP